MTIETMNFAVEVEHFEIGVSINMDFTPSFVLPGVTHLAWDECYDDETVDVS